MDRLRLARLRALIVFAVATTVANPAPAQTAATTANQTAALKPEVQPQQLQLDTTYTTWFDRRLSVAEARIEAQKDAESRLQTLIAIISMVFGALMTTLVIFFALRTERTAAASATKAAQEAVASGKAEVEACVRAAEVARNEADRILTDIRTGYGEAETHIAKLRAAAKVADAYQSTDDTAEQLSEKDETALRKGAEYLERQPASSWTQEDFVVLCTAALDKKDYDRAIELAWLERNLDKTDLGQAHSLNIEGIALARQKKCDEAIKKYEELIEKFDEIPEEKVVRIVALAKRNKAISLSEKGDKDGAVALLDEIIEEQKDSPLDRLRLNAARSYATKYRALRDQNKLDEADRTVSDARALWADASADVRISVGQLIIFHTLLLQKNARIDDAIRALDDLIEKLADDQEVATTLLEPAIRRLRQLHRAADDLGE